MVDVSGGNGSEGFTEDGGAIYDENYNLIAERRGFQTPSHPGNYPKNLIQKLNCLKATSSPADKLDGWSEELHKPTLSDGIVMIADIRNFTKTLENNDAEKALMFLNQLFMYSGDRIHGIEPESSFVNKLLGDGLFAHIKKIDNYSDTISSVIEAAKEIIICYNGLKNQYGYNLTNLSIAIGNAEYYLGSIGGSQYLDYSLVGSDINSLFRLLSHTEGGMVFFSKSLRQHINRTHHYVYLGELKYKGMLGPESCFSIIRQKNPIETDNTQYIETCPKDCRNYRLCSRAWEKGRERITAEESQYVFDLDCNECGESFSQCTQWGSCLTKLKNAEDGLICECCHVCRNFRNCFHSYQLGRRGRELITCDKDILESLY